LDDDEELQHRVAAEQRGAPFLIYRDASGKEQIYTLEEAAARSVVVGREATTGVWLHWDEEVSRVHAQLERLGDDWALVDDGLSSNGSYVNGELVKGRRRLEDGDELQFGDTTVLYRSPRNRRSRRTAISASRPPRAGVFRREADYWTISYEGQVIRVRDSKGLQYIAELLRHPGVEFHVLDLVGVGAAGSERELEGPLRNAPSSELGMHVGRLADAGKVLDSEARAQYKKRLEDLNDELREAESFNDVERAARAREEIEFLTQELAGAVGLGGRDRKAASSAERARVSVTKAIKTAERRIAESHADLANYLSVTIRTGMFCSYLPDLGAPILWDSVSD
jgi:FHA domain